MSEIVLPAIVLLDEPGGNHWATLVSLGRKTIETRNRRMNFTGDIVICCAGSSKTKNAGKALCMVHWGPARKMVKEDQTRACVRFNPDLWVYDLTNLRQFNDPFLFSPLKVSGSFQGIFHIGIPEGKILF